MNRSHKLLPLEGLRGIASFVVVLWHLRLVFYETAVADMLARLAFLPHRLAYLLVAGVEGLYNGVFAVWLFWILSGFVLALQFFMRARETSSTSAHDYLEEACLRRYPRLLVPVFASILFAYVVYALGWMHNLPLAQVLGDKSGWMSSFYTFPASALGAIKSALWDTFFAFDRANSYNAILWTMEKEFYGSLFLFAFLGLFGHRNSRFFLYFVVARIAHKFGMDWINAFIAGIALSDLFVNLSKLSFFQRVSRNPVVHFARNSRVLAVVLWGSLIVCVGLPNNQDRSYLFLGVAAVALAMFSTPTRHFFSNRIPVFLGKISFGLYLVHWPLIFSFSCWAYLITVKSLGASLAPVLVSAATCVLSLLLGYGLYVVADRPALGLSRWLARLVMFALPLRGRTPAPSPVGSNLPEKGSVPLQETSVL